MAAVTDVHSTGSGWEEGTGWGLERQVIVSESRTVLETLAPVVMAQVTMVVMIMVMVMMAVLVTNAA